MPWLVEHLKNPPDACLCNKSSKINELRKNAIKFLEYEY